MKISCLTNFFFWHPDASKEYVGILFTTFGKQRYSSDKRKWFEIQKKTALSLGEKFEQNREDVVYSIGTYGNTAELSVPILSPLARTKLGNALNNIRDPLGVPDVYKALELADKRMFRENTASKYSNKILILFIEQGIEMNENILEKSKSLRGKGVEILAVVMGDTVSTAGLDQLIGDTGKLILVKQPDSTLDLYSTTSEMKNAG